MACKGMSDLGNGPNKNKPTAIIIGKVNAVPHIGILGWCIVIFSLVRTL